jgi:hypothetical protein
MYDAAKALKDINDATIRNGAVIELQEKILSARDAQSALLERVSELEKEVTRFETWEREKQRYEFKALRVGLFVYMLKPAERGTEPPHWLCVKCYEDGKRSPFQSTTELVMSRRLYRCDRCKSTIAPYSEPKWID